MNHVFATRYEKRYVKIIIAHRYYLSTHQIPNRWYSFDFIEFESGKIAHWTNHFR